MRISRLLLLAGLSAGTAFAQAPADQVLDQESIYVPLVSTPGPGRIAYVNDDTAGWSIHVVNGDGSGDHAITDFPLNTPNNPSWSPDGTRLAFDEYEQGTGTSRRQMYVMGDDGSNVEQITTDPGGATNPAWSPDGSRIAFVSTRDGNQEIYVIDADGSNLVRLTNHAAADTEPGWSPDSSHLVFTSERDGNAEIYSVLANGSNPTRLTTDEAVDTTPAWSPNGLWIVFCSQRLSTSGQFLPANLRIMSSNGSGAVDITKTDDQNDCGPTWSSDSTRIVFTRGAPQVAPPSSVLYNMSVDGTQVSYLVGSWRYNFSPVWTR